MTETFGNPDAVRSQGQALLRVQQGLGTVIDLLTGKVNALVPEDWYGHGADAFVNDWANRAQQVTQLYGLCGHIGQVLLKLADELDAANKQASRAQNLVPGPVAGRGLDPAGEQKAQQMLSQAEQAAQQAWNTARSQLAGIGVPEIGPGMTVSRVDAWAERLDPLPKPAPWYESIWHGIEHGAEDVGNFIANNAGQLAEIFGGAALTDFGVGLIGLGAGGEAGGLLLDATGVGAIPGLALNAGGALAIAGGVTAAGTGTALAGDGFSNLHMMASDTGGGGSSSASVPEDPDLSRLSPAERDTLDRLQHDYPDRGFKTAAEERDGEYLDQQGRTYDQMGDPQTSLHWNTRQAQVFRAAIDSHLRKSVDYTVIDLTGFSEESRTDIEAYVNSLRPEEQAKIIRVGF